MDKDKDLLKKLNKMINSTKSASLDDLHQLITAFTSVIKDLDKQYNEHITHRKGELSLETTQALEKIQELKKGIEKRVDSAEKSSSENIQKLTRQLKEDVARMDAMIESMPHEMPDVESLEKRVNEKIDNLKILTMEDIGNDMPTIAQKVRDALETLTDEGRLDASFIRGLDKREAALSDTLINRAIGIVDQRTSFLVQRVSNLTTRIESAESSSGTVTSVSSADGNATVANPTTTPVITIVSAPKLQTARTIGGVSFNGTANITVASATGGFTVSGGDLVLGANNITLTGSLAATGARVTKGWFTDVESTNMPTVGGVAILTSLTAPQFTTIEVGHASDTTLSRASAGDLAVEGNLIYRAGGTDVPVADGGTGLSAIAALSILVANSANTFAALTPGAGNSLRINAGGTAWEAYTPSGGVPTTITVANEATDTTCFLAFFTAATGDLAPKTNANLTFNSSTGVVTLVAPILGTPTSVTLTNATGLPLTGLVSDTTTALGLGSINLGHASDTTITRAAAGQIAVEGVNVVTVSSTDTLSNKTLTAPKFADLGFIADANGNELIIFDTVASAVNEITLANAATTTNPTLTASGGDINVGIDIVLKGTGTFNLKGNATQAAQLRLYEDTDAGTNFSAFKVGTQASDITYTLPTAVGAAGTYLKDAAGDGVLSWATAGGTSTPTKYVDTGADVTNLSQETGSGGSVTKASNFPGITLNTETTTTSAGGWAILGYNPTGSTLTTTTSAFLAGSPYMTINLMMNNMNTATNTASSFFGIGYRAAVASGFDYTTFTHVGFKLIKTGGAVSLYATQTSGGANTASSALTTVVDGDVLELSFKINGSSSVDYYWRKNGGALSSATNLSTNVPTAAVGTLYFGVANNNTATSFNIAYQGFTYERS